MRLSLASSRISTPALPTGVALVAVLALAPLIGWAIAKEEWRIFALLLLVAAVPALIRWPVPLVFGVYAFMVPFDAVGVLTSAGGATVSKLLGILAAALLLGVGMVERRLVRPPVTALWLGVFTLWGLLSIGWSVDLATSTARVFSFISFLLLYVAAVSFRVSAKELRSVIIFTMLGGVLAALVPLYFGTDALIPSGRATLTLQDRVADANKFAAGLILPLLLLVGRFIDSRSFQAKAVSIGAMAVIVNSIYLTASRSALLAIVLGIGLLVWRSRRVGHALFVVAVFAILVAFAPDALVTRVNRVVEGEDVTGTNRTLIWAVGVHALQDYWIFGSGLSTFPHIYGMYASVPPRELASAPHSIYIGTWVELGIVGLALLLLTFGMHFRAVFGCRRPSIDVVALQASCVAAMVAAAFLDHLGVKAFWLPWTLLMWSVRLHAEEPRTVEAPSDDESDRADSPARS
jgi:O-antigen ligase